MMEKTCKLCGKTFITASKYSNKKFCDYKCRFKSLMPTSFDNECFEWPLSFNKKTGYGQMSISDTPGHILATHRISYEIYNGQISDGMLIRHTCDNRKCVNPIHLIAGTQADNINDMWERNRQQNYKSIPKGENNPASKLKNDDVLYIRSSKERRSVLAKRFNVSVTTIRAIINFTLWKDI